MASKNYKKAYNPSIDRVTVLSIQSSKGLEFNRVVMLGLGLLNHDNLAQDAKLLYLAIIPSNHARRVRYNYVCQLQTFYVIDWHRYNLLF